MPESLAITLPPPAQSPLGTAALASVGIALPRRTVTNDEIAARLDVSERWIVERTGVRERRHVDASSDLLELATTAAERALRQAGIGAHDIDLVLAATMSHEWLTPNLAPLVASRIGAGQAGAFDIGGACTGFMGALALASAQVESGRARTALVIGADQMSLLTDPLDRSTAALFGDGAGAVLVTAADAVGGRIGPIVLGSDGARAELVRAECSEAILRMQGQDTFREAVRRLSEATREVLALEGLEVADVDAFIFHQANARILRAVGERVDLPPERVVDCISRYGNTSAASVPLALSDALGSGLLREGGRALLAAFGGGLTWAATVIEWGPPDVA